MKTNKIYYGWFIVAACMILSALGIGVFSNIIGLFFTSIKETYGYTQAQVSAIVSVAMLAGLPATVICANFYKKYSTRWLVLIFGIGMAAACFAMSLTTSLVTLYIASALLGVFSIGATALSSPILITNWFVKKRGTAMGLAVAGAGFGPFLMSPVISKTIGDYGYEKGFVVLSIIMLVGILVAFIIIRDEPQKIGLVPYGEGEELEDNNKQVSTACNYTLKEAIRTPMFYTFAAFLVIMAITVQGLLIQIPSYFSEVGFDEARIGILVGTYALIATGGKILIGYVYDKIGVFKGNFIFYSSMIFAVIMLNFTVKNDSLVYGYIIFAGIGLGLIPVAQPLVSSLLFGRKHYSSIYPLFMILFSIGAIGGGICSGVIIDMYGYTTLFGFTITLMLIALVALQTTMKLSVTAHEKKLKEENIC